jgi:hypothetical protein
LIKQENAATGGATVWKDVGHLVDLPCQIFQLDAIFQIRCPTSTRRKANCNIIESRLPKSEKSVLAGC